MKIAIRTANSGETWTPIRGTLDSGCTRSSLSLQEHLGGIPFSPIPIPLLKKFVDANGNMARIKGTAIIDVKIELKQNKEPILISNLEVMVMDNPNWKTFLIGTEVLFKLKILPWQILNRYTDLQPPPRKIEMGDVRIANPTFPQNAKDQGYSVEDEDFQETEEVYRVRVSS